VKLFGLTFGERKGSGSSMAEIHALLADAQRSSKSGASVNWKTAAEVSAAIACARVIAEGLAQVPFKLFRESTGGGRDPAKDHRLYGLLSHKPNPWQTSYEFRETIALHLVFCGNAYVFINRSAGKVLELLPFQPQQITVKRSDWEISYEVTTANGNKIAVPPSEMWHLRGPSWDGVVGLEAVKLAREAIGLALATEEHGARMFSNGARVGGILSSDASLKEDQVKLLRESWERTQGGVSNAFKTAILWGGLKWAPMAMPNDQAQLIEQRRFQVEEICRHFRVMPIMVGYSDKAATYASAEQMFLAHVVHTLGPWYSRLEQSAEANLLTEAELAAGYYFKFIASGLMRGAHADRATYFSKALGSGGSPAWMTQDEVRALEELNPMGGSASELPEPTNVGGTPPVEPKEPDPGSKAMAAAIVQLAERPQPDNVFHIAAPSIDVKAGDTHVTLPEGCIQLDATINTPDIKTGDVHVAVPAPLVTLAQPRKTIDEIERDADHEIKRITRTVKD
jgi:HK97 family phage portal protein